MKSATIEKKESKVEPILNTYNGGTNDKYTWSQEIKEVEVAIEIDSTITAKMVLLPLWKLKVTLKASSVSIRKTTGEVIIEGELAERINASESMWKI